LKKLILITSLLLSTYSYSKEKAPEVDEKGVTDNLRFLK
jgi:hypothetical protein